MSRIILMVLALMIAPASPAPAQSIPGVPSHVAAVLRQIKAVDRDLLAVSEEDGLFLRVTAVANRSTRALEIGGASGYSAIWIGLAMRQTGGSLTTIEYDPARAKALADNIKKAGLSDVVTPIAGDAFKEIPKLKGDFDFVFLDAWKPDYKKFFDMVLPRLKPGGVFLAHNVVNKRGEMEDFIEAIKTNPAVLTAFVSPSHEGMSVSVKIR